MLCLRCGIDLGPKLGMCDKCLAERKSNAPMQAEEEEESSAAVQQEADNETSPEVDEANESVRDTETTTSASDPAKHGATLFILAGLFLLVLAGVVFFTKKPAPPPPISPLGVWDQQLQTQDKTTKYKPYDGPLE